MRTVVKVVVGVGFWEVLVDGVKVVTDFCVLCVVDNVVCRLYVDDSFAVLFSMVVVVYLVFRLVRVDCPVTFDVVGFGVYFVEVVDLVDFLVEVLCLCVVLRVLSFNVDLIVGVDNVVIAVSSVEGVVTLVADFVVVDVTVVGMNVVVEVKAGEVCGMLGKYLVDVVFGIDLEGVADNCFVVCEVVCMCFGVVCLGEMGLAVELPFGENFRTFVEGFRTVVVIVVLWVVLRVGRAVLTVNAGICFSIFVFPPDWLSEITGPRFTVVEGVGIGLFSVVGFLGGGPNPWSLPTMEELSVISDVWLCCGRLPLITAYAVVERVAVVTVETVVELRVVEGVVDGAELSCPASRNKVRMHAHAHAKELVYKPKSDS